MTRSPVAEVRSWPEEARRRYRALGLWTPETFAELVEDRTARFSPRLAVVGVDAHGVERRWTYADLGRRARAVADRFRRLGVEPGDRVVVALPNVVELVECLLGLFRLGALPVFALPTHREVELVQFCTLADAAALAVAVGADGVDHATLLARVADRVAERGVEPPLVVDVSEWHGGEDDADSTTSHTEIEIPLPATDPEGVALLQLSGGTTGVAKLIPRTHSDYLYSVRASAEICGLHEETVQLVALPAAHNFAMSSPGILGVLHTGGTVVLARDPSPRTVFRLVEAERVTLAAAVPPLAQAWVSAARRRHPDLSSLEVLQVGGARLADTIAPEVEEVLGVRLQQVFGMAEGLVNYTRDDDPPAIAHTTQGRPISAEDEIRVVDAEDRDVPEGAEGALLTRGPYTIRGYYRDPRADRDAFTDDGFYRTGDLVRRLPSGHLVVTGRDKDQINRGGEKVSVEEIEGLALAHPDVLDAVAVGVPDAFLGERIVLVVSTEPGRSQPSDLAGYLRAGGLATFKVPDEVVHLDLLPATHVGKNSRRELRRLLSAELSTAPPAFAAPTTHSREG